jgi:hypothetical protein
MTSPTLGNDIEYTTQKTEIEIRLLAFSPCSILIESNTRDTGELGYTHSTPDRLLPVQGRLDREDPHTFLRKEEKKITTQET